MTDSATASAVASPAAQKTLLIFGETQAGKTTLITAALMGSQANRLIGLVDRDRSLDQLTEAGITQRARWLFEGRRVDSTASTNEFSLTMVSNKRLRIYDIKGNDTQQAHNLREWIPRADGILCIVECCGPRLANQMAAIRTLLPLIPATRMKIGLAITKCEQLLSPFDPAWESKSGSWNNSGLNAEWDRWKEELKAFGSAVWATSAFGFHDDRPACILTEYGQFLPYNIKPKNACEPFLWFLQEFALC